MDWQTKVGIGIAVFFGLLPYAVKDLPHWVTWGGIAFGVLFGLSGLIPGHEKIPNLLSFVFIACASGAVGSGIGL